tara:strand:+ start:41 stop:193 length:153 start_codon:yes stop_codon:yes gene_type:complete
MDNIEQAKDLPSVEFNKDDYSDDYKFLVQKLKSIKAYINLLEKNFLDKEI